MHLSITFRWILKFVAILEIIFFQKRTCPILFACDYICKCVWHPQLRWESIYYFRTGLWLSLPNSLTYIYIMHVWLKAIKVKIKCHKWCHLIDGGSSRRLMAKVLNCSIIVSEFKLQLCYYVHFHINTLRKGMNPPPLLPLTNTVHLQEWLWHFF